MGRYFHEIQQKQSKRKAVTQRCSVKKLFLEISQNSQENTCARVSLGLQLYYKSEIHFPADLVTFTEEILNGKLHFRCSDLSWMPGW